MHLPKLMGAAGLAAVLQIIGSLPVQACTCIASPTVENWRDHVDVIFQGTITSRSMLLWGDAIFRVSRIWKGNVGSQFRVEWRQGDHGDCNGFWSSHLKVGTELLVFAKRGNDGIYRTSICYPTAPVPAALVDIAKLGQSKRPSSQ
jgi:hypothetical protein